MSSVSVEGIYENGKVTLLETPAGVEKARVRVTFLPDMEQTDGGAERKEAALQRMMGYMSRGVDFGGGKFDRQELYEERLSQMEQRRG